MANTAAVLRGYLASALKDTAYETWSAADMDSLILRAVASLYPRVQYALDPTIYTQLLTQGTYYYAINPIIVSIYRIDAADSSGSEMGPLDDQAWEIVGDLKHGTGLLHVAPFVADAGPTVRYVGYGRYNTTAAYVTDELVPLVIAEATADAYNWQLADRARFKQWQGSAQKQNISVTEMLGMVGEARQKREILRRQQVTIRKPMPGRQ